MQILLNVSLQLRYFYLSFAQRTCCVIVQKYEKELRKKNAMPLTFPLHIALISYFYILNSCWVNL
jgi:hypothetical protein